MQKEVSLHLLGSQYRLQYQLKNIQRPQGDVVTSTWISMQATVPAQKTSRDKTAYLNHKLECTSCIGIATDNNDNVDIADAYIQERAATYLAHRTSAQFLGLHNICAECIHHVASAR
jgi:hypothetical protein